MFVESYTRREILVVSCKEWSNGVSLLRCLQNLPINELRRAGEVRIDMKVIIYDDRKRDRSALKKLLADYKRNYHHDLEILEYEEIPKEKVQKDTILEFAFVEGRTNLKAEDIIYIETSRHKNLFYTKTQVYSIYKKLSELEDELSPYGFVRIHLSFIVNMQYIDKISSYVLRLTNGKEISVPKSRYAEVKRRYAAFKEESEDNMKCEEETE